MADSAGTSSSPALHHVPSGRRRGCPWDREQSRESLKPYLIEEAYEALEAIDSGRPEHIQEELGDVLFQVVFHSQVARERGEFTMADLLARLNAKMIRRHPHVFAEGQVADADEALTQWERIKRTEGKAGRLAPLRAGGRPRLAARAPTRAARLAGEGWPRRLRLAGVARGLAQGRRGDGGELERAAAEGDTGRVREELSDLLFSVVNVARLLGVDAEDSLREAAEKFTRRFNEVEGR